MKKWLTGTAAIVAVATATGLVGCSTGGGGGGETELSFMMWGDGGDTDKAYEKVIDAFEKENPDITINAEFFNTNDYHNILKTRMSGGAGPDVYGVDFGNIPDFVRDGFAADLTEGGDYLEKLTDEAMEETKRYSEDGGSYNVPISLSGNGIIYNQDLFEQVGITEEPTTKSELIDASEKLLAAGITPFAMSAQDNWWPQFIVYYALAENGADEELAEQMLAGEADFSSNEAWKESLDFVKELVPYYMPNPLGTTQTAAQSAFLAGEAAMFPATWILNDARKADMNAGYMNFPTVDEVPDEMWGTYQVRWGVNPGNGNQEAAQKFINFFFEDEVYTEFLSEVRLFPVTTTVEADESLDPLFPDMQQSWEGKKFIALFSPANTEMQESLLVVLQNIISGQQTTEEGLAELDQALANVQAQQ